MQIDTLGDSALIVDLADEASNSAKVLARALSAAKIIEDAKLPGVVDVTSSYESIAVFFNLDQIEPDMEDKIRTLVASAGASVRRKQRRIGIPVCYDDEFALDLERIANHTSLTRDAIVALHASAQFTVACIGFMPGFPFLAGLPEKLRVPRLATPRTKVPAGSVAIANAQAGVYPLESPGGWNVLGRTPLRLFQVDGTPPTLLRPGDIVQFRKITRAEFEKLNEKVAGMQSGSSRVKPSDGTGATSNISRRHPATPLGRTMSLTSAGFQTTVQDCGRVGLRKYGVTPGGALDPVSLRLANLLVGNSECGAGLECASGRLRLRFHDERLLAWAGGAFELRMAGKPVSALHCACVSIDTEIQIVPQGGGRLWLAISGGIDVPEILGSRTTDLRAHFGGWQGRVLRDGDELPLGVESESCSQMRDEIPDRVSDWSAPQFVTRKKFLRIVRGRHWDDETGGKLLGQKFRVAMNSDRMGLRLEGEEIAPSRRGELVSEAVAPGTIQLPPNGAPLLLLQGCQTIGGYPKIAHVITVDLGWAAQLQPLDEVRFELIELEGATELLRERERDLALFRAGLQARFA